MEKKRNAIRTERDLEIQKLKDSRGIYEINHDKINDIIEIAEKKITNYKNNNLITQISYLFEDLSEKQVEYYLTTMKEFIQGINLKGEENNLKKINNPEIDEKPNPKYKDLIIGNSYIIKSNKEDLIKKLID